MILGKKTKAGNCHLVSSNQALGSEPRLPLQKVWGSIRRDGTDLSAQKVWDSVETLRIEVIKGSPWYWELYKELKTVVARW